MLRDYQIAICAKVKEAFETYRSVMMQMPTGTGKTVVLAELVQQYLNVDLNLDANATHCQVLIVAHRIELIEQTGEHLQRFGIAHGVITGGKKPKEMKPVMVASIQTLAKNLNVDLNLYPSLVVIDEAHHAVAKSYRLLWDVWPKARFLGLTATPYRLSGEGFTDLFDTFVGSWTVQRFIAEGWLSPYDYYSIPSESDEQKLIDSLKKRGTDGDFQVRELREKLDVASCIERLFESFERFASDKKGIIYAIDIAHAEHIAAYYRPRGVRAVAISSKTPMKEREELIRDFKGNIDLSYTQSSLNAKRSTLSSIQILVSVDLFSEGFDCPDVEFIQVTRPTLSLTKYLQMVGRGLRPYMGKECCILIDNVGLYRRFGLPSTDRDWRAYFVGHREAVLNEELGYRNEELGYRNEELGIRNADTSVNAPIEKITGHEGMVLRFAHLGKAGFERRQRGKAWVWIDTLTGVEFDRHPVTVDFKGMALATSDGELFFPRIRSKWIDAKHGISRKTLETQVGDGIGWMKQYVSLNGPDKVYALRQVMANGMRIYEDEQGAVYLQQDLDHPLIRETEVGGREAFMAWCDAKQKEWAGSRWSGGFLQAGHGDERWNLPKGATAKPDGAFYQVEIDGRFMPEQDRKEFWVDWDTGFTFAHRPIVRYRGFVQLVYDGDQVYILNIHEERFIPYHNWEIRADDRICTIGNKLYLRSDKDGKALRIRKRSGDFQLFVVDVPMDRLRHEKTLQDDSMVMIINKSGKELEFKRVPPVSFSILGV